MTTYSINISESNSYWNESIIILMSLVKKITNLNSEVIRLDCDGFTIDTLKKFLSIDVGDKLILNLSKTYNNENADVVQYGSVYYVNKNENKSCISTGGLLMSIDQELIKHDNYYILITKQKKKRQNTEPDQQRRSARLKK